MLRMPWLHFWYRRKWRHLVRLFYTVCGLFGCLHTLENQWFKRNTDNLRSIFSKTEISLDFYIYIFFPLKCWLQRKCFYPISAWWWTVCRLTCLLFLSLRFVYPTFDKLSVKSVHCSHPPAARGAFLSLFLVSRSRISRSGGSTGWRRLVHRA